MFSNILAAVSEHVKLGIIISTYTIILLYLTSCLYFHSYSLLAVLPTKAKSENTKRTFSKQKVLGKIIYPVKERLGSLCSSQPRKEYRIQYKMTKKDHKSSEVLLKVVERL